MEITINCYGQPAPSAPVADHSEPEQPEAGAEIPPAPETVPEPTGASMLFLPL